MCWDMMLTKFSPLTDSDPGINELEDKSDDEIENVSQILGPPKENIRRGIRVVTHNFVC